MSEITVSWDASPSPGATYNLYRGTAPGNESPVAYASGVAAPPSSPLTSVAASVSGFATYTGTIANGAGDALAGMKMAIAGFAGASNNGVFLVESSTATAVVVANASAVAESATAAAVPRPYFTDTSVLQGKIYSYKITAVVAGVESVDSVEVLSPPVPYGATPATVVVGIATSFEVLAGSTVTNTGASVIAGDVGVSPGTSLTGFSSATVAGLLHPGDSAAANAQSALLAAYTDAQTRVGATTIPADIGGMTFGPGVYNVASSLAITGILTLDAGGNPNAVFIFQIGSTLTTAVTNSTVVLVNGAQTQNVFFAVGSSATLNGSTSFAGTIMAQASITVNAGVNVNGRLLAISGAVTLNDDNIEMFISARLGLYATGALFPVGTVIFDCATASFQQVMVGGTSGATRPVFSAVLGTTVLDGSVVWITIDPSIPVVVSGLPPANPFPPPAPAAPLNPAISSET